MVETFVSKKIFGGLILVGTHSTRSTGSCVGNPHKKSQTAFQFVKIHLYVVKNVSYLYYNKFRPQIPLPTRKIVFEAS